MYRKGSMDSMDRTQEKYNTNIIPSNKKKNSFHTPGDPEFLNLFNNLNPIGNKKAMTNQKRKKFLRTGKFLELVDFQNFWQTKTYDIFNDLINKKVHIGQHKKYLNTEMRPYVFGYLNDFCIINLNHTIIQLRIALKIIYDTISNGGHVTIIGTKNSYLDHVELFANNIGMSYVASTKWLGGALTNFEIIEKNFEKQLNAFVSMDRTQEQRSFQHTQDTETTPKHIKDFGVINQKKLDLFKGLRDMGPSDLLIILNPAENQTALNEARILGIPVIALVDTHTSFKLIDYPIVANNESLLSLSYFLQLFNFAIRVGLKNKKFLESYSIKNKKRSWSEENKNYKKKRK